MHPSGVGKPMTKHAAQHGFHNMTVFYMTKLVGLLGYQFKRGKTQSAEPAYGPALAELILGEVSDAEFAFMMECRGKDPNKTKLVEESLLLATGNIDVLQGNIDNLDLDKPIADLKKQLRRQQAGRSGGGGGAGGPSGGEPPDEPEPRGDPSSSSGVRRKQMPVNMTFEI